MSAPWVMAGTLVADGKTLEYSCLGPPPDSAPTLVLLHEGLGCNRLWRDFPAALVDATRFGVFTYSRAGYGQSDPVDLPRPLDYMTREAVDVLPEILDAIGVQSAVLVGHSDGGTIAAIHAGHVTEPRVAGVVLMAPHFFTEEAGLTEIAKARHAFENGDLSQRLGKYHRDPDNAFRGWCDSWLDPDFKTWNVVGFLDGIRVPVLTIQGREDPYGTLAQIDVVTQRVKHAPVSFLILDDCKHAPHLEHGPAVVAAIAQFCERLGAETVDGSQSQPTVQPNQLPAYAYVPGQNERHPEDTFDSIRRTAVQGHDADQLAHSEAFQAGLRFLEAGFYWESHEVLEPVWMVLPDASTERQFVQGLIQLANGCLKLRMDRPKAALRLVGQARGLVPADKSMWIMTLEMHSVHGWIDELERKVMLAL